jgi:hypothetical protein
MTDAPTLADAFRAALAPIAAPATGSAADLSRYRPDPVLYARERLGLEIILPHQQCLMYAVANRWERITPEMAALAHLKNPGQRFIAVTSGQKTGKTLSIIVLCLWHFECFAKSRSFMTAAIENQIRSVLWSELKKVMREAKARPQGNLSEDPARGLLSDDESREIRGFTGRKIEALAGISGNLAYFIDEASHLEQPKAEVIEGNTAGGGDLGAPILYTSQPTRSEGPFFDAFHSKAAYATTMVFDSEEIAEYQARKKLVIPGMATLERVRGWKEKYGEDSPFYIVRVKGGFLRNETGKIIAYHFITAAQLRHATAPEEGRLQIGIDCAGEGERGDEWAFSLVRGKKQVAKFEHRGKTTREALEILRGLLATFRWADEIPWVVIDNEGPIGFEFFLMCAEVSERLKKDRPPESFEAFGVKASGKAKREPNLYERRRDELWANLARWIREEGAIVTEQKLEDDLHCPDWVGTLDGRLKATPKDEMKERLRGRSPDRGDALALSVWNPAEWIDDTRVEAEQRAPAEHNAGFDAYTRSAVDPYALLGSSMGSRR